MEFVSREEFEQVKANQILRCALTKRLERLLKSNLYRGMTLAQKIEARRELQNKINATF